MKFPDREWKEGRWREIVEYLVKEGLLNWREVATIALGQLNPPQVGTQVASKKEVQAHYDKKKTWQAVKKWLYAQDGKCRNCGTRIELQADHIVPREKGGSDKLNNFQLLCRRCNVIRRPSHKKGGVTYLTSETALMWILFLYKPKTYEEFKKLCREYGLTMADIRFQEAWAMAIWLNKLGKYTIEEKKSE